MSPSVRLPLVEPNGEAKASIASALRHFAGCCPGDGIANLGAVKMRAIHASTAGLSGQPTAHSAANRNADCPTSNDDEISPDLRRDQAARPNRAPIGTSLQQPGPPVP